MIQMQENSACFLQRWQKVKNWCKIKPRDKKCLDISSENTRCVAHSSQIWIYMDFEICEHGTSAGSKDLIWLDYHSIILAFKRGVFEKMKF